MKPAVLNMEELSRLLTAEFPQMYGPKHGLTVEAVRYCGCQVRQAFREGSIRPGGTISGATMMALGDFAVYVAILASIGWVPLAVTTNLSINFLRKPAPGDLIADCRLLKLGKRLAVGEASILSGEALVAHVTATYSIPQEKS